MTLVLIGRAFGGAGAAGSITIASIYSNEVAESRIRGTLGIIVDSSIGIDLNIFILI